MSNDNWRTMTRPASSAPKLPGYSFWDPVEAQKTRPQTLKYSHGHAVLNNRALGSAGTMGTGSLEDALEELQLNTARLDAKRDTLLAHKITNINHWPEYQPADPQWITFNRQVLRFYAYFKEAVTESRLENYRIRRCHILYYLEDGTLHVDEPKEDNSGVPKGVFLKRHLVLGREGNPVTFEDLDVGGQVTLYERTFHIVGCDKFTRSFLQEQGREVAADMPYPEDPYRTYVESKVRPAVRQGTSRIDPKTKQFLDMDRKVLRFFCVWDDTRNLYGDVIPLSLQYYLADDTIEVTEVHQRNSGRDPFPKLLARMKLPMNEAPRPTTAVYKIRARKPEFVHWKDLTVGGVVNVYNRLLFLHDCDQFTRSYYSEQGVEQPEPIAVHLTEPPTVGAKTLAPAWYDIGKEQDQMQNVLHLIPKPPPSNFQQFMENDRKVLRFVAAMADHPGTAQLSSTDKTRTFVISYFLADNTLQIFEPPTRNSGIVSGKFLERQEVKKPDGTVYKATDLFVGARIIVFRRCFELTDADEYSLALQESMPDLFPRSDAGLVNGHVAEAVREAVGSDGQRLRAALVEADRASTGSVSAQEFKAALASIGADILLAEAVTVVRSAAGEDKSKGRAPIATLVQLLGF